MALSLNASKESFLFEISRSKSQLSVVDFTFREKLSYFYSNKIELVTDSEIKTFDDIIGREAVLTVVNNDILSGGGNRYFHGVVRRFEYTGQEGRKFKYDAEAVPAIHFMGLRRNCRIFQEKKTQDIVKTLLEEAGIRSNRYRFALSDTDRTRGYCVQYQESDLDFISRLMREEGIYYYFEHSKDKHVMVITDTKAVHPPISGSPTVTCNPGGMVAESDYIYNFTLSQRQTSEVFTHGNFNFKKPTLDLTRKRTSVKEPLYEFYDYSAMHTTQAKGDTLAKVRMEQLVALQKQGHGDSTCCRLTPGYKVTLTDNPASSLNGEYLIIEATHGGSQPQTREETGGGASSYSNQFTVIPAQTQYRPPMLDNRPVVNGVQTAIVVGPSSEEIYTDDHGRVKVQFHWDREGVRNEHSSCWLRVSQSWGGGDWGAQFIPRIGDEVLVDFIEGNPDRPIVTGCVYNGDNIPINPLTKSITQSGFRTRTHKGEGYHELRFDDKTGEEEIYLQSQKDWNILIKNDKGQNVGHDENLTIANNRTKNVGVDQSETIGKNKTINVGENHTETIGKDKVLTVNGNHIENIKGDTDIAMSGELKQTVTKGMTEKIGDNFTVNIGKNADERTGDNKTIDVGKKFSTHAADQILTMSDKQIRLESGSATVIINSAGDVTINGTSIMVKASGEIVLKGSKVYSN